MYLLSLILLLLAAACDAHTILYSQNTALAGGGVRGTRAVSTLYCKLFPEYSALNCTDAYALLTYSFLDTYEALPINQSAEVYSTSSKRIARNWTALVNNDLELSLSSAGVTTLEYWLGNPSFNCEAWTSSSDCSKAVYGTPIIPVLSFGTTGCELLKTVVCVCDNGNFLTTPSPTNAPTSKSPSGSPTRQPTNVPSLSPSTHPTTLRPTTVPSRSPTETFFAYRQNGQFLVGSGAIGNPFLGISTSVSADGRTAVAGGNLDASSVGATWVFTRSGNTWTQQGSKLVGTGNVGASQQGTSVSISGDGNTIAVGGPNDNSNQGAAWIFVRSGSSWTQQGSKLVGSGGSGTPLRCFSISLSNNGNVMACGAPSDSSSNGAAWVFTRSGTTWSQQGAKIVPAVSTTAQIGNSIAISADGTYLVLGAPGVSSNLGAVYVCTFGGVNWSLYQTLTALRTTNSRHGIRVAISADNNYIIVGMIQSSSFVGDTAVYFKGTALTWGSVSRYQGTGSSGLAAQGRGVAISHNGTVFITGGADDASQVGAFWAFQNDPGVGFVQSGAKMVSSPAVSNSQFGFGLALSEDGNIAVVGSPERNSSQGGVWFFNKTFPEITHGPTLHPTTLHPTTLNPSKSPSRSPTGSFFAFVQDGPKYVPSGYGTGTSQIGFSVANSADGTTAVIGANTDEGGTGAVWVYTRNTTGWFQQGPKIVANDAAGDANQGSAVGISLDGNTIVVGGSSDNMTRGAAWVFTRTGSVWTQQGGKLVGSGASGLAYQGYSVALSGAATTLVSGGSNDAIGVGATWVFTRTGSTWGQQGAKLVGTGYVGSPSQGYSVSVSGDGATLVTGGPLDSSDTGATWVFVRSGITWTQQGSKLVGTGGSGNPSQGYSVKLSFDSNTLLVGGFYDDVGVGAAWVFTRSGTTWTQQGGKLVGVGGIPGQQLQGYSVSLSHDGNIALIGGQDNDNGIGAFWVWKRSVGVWTQSGIRLVGTGYVNEPKQGNAISLSTDGNVAVVGGWRDDTGVGAFWMWNNTVPESTVSPTVMPSRSPSKLPSKLPTTASPSISPSRSPTRPYYAFVQNQAKVLGTGGVGTPRLGFSAAMSADGTTAIAGASNDDSGVGAAFVYTRNGLGVWSQQGSKLVGSGSTFDANQGWSVALSADGNTAAIGGIYDNSSRGATWVFTRTGSTWTQQGNKLVGNWPSFAFQGHSVSLSYDGNTLFVGAPIFQNLFSQQGAVFIFTRTGSTWTQQQRLEGTDNSGFGSAVSSSADGKTIVVGSPEAGSSHGFCTVYVENGGVWSIQQSGIQGTSSLTTNQGNAVSMAYDGNTFIVGGSSNNGNGGNGIGAAWVFTRSGSTWTQQGAKLQGTGTQGPIQLQGQTVAINYHATVALVCGALDNVSQGACWVYLRSGSTWTQSGAKLVGSGNVGAAVQGSGLGLSADGNLAIIGGESDDSGAGAVWFWNNTVPESTLAPTPPTLMPSRLPTLAPTLAPTILPTSKSPSMSPTIRVVAFMQNGAKLVGTGNIGQSQQGRCAISGDGSTAVVGGPNDNFGFGAVWIFTRSGNTWTQQGSKLIGTGSSNSFPNQGTSVATTHDGNTIAFGAITDGSGFTFIGAVWIFTRSGTTWTQQGSKLIGTPNSGSAVYFGASVALASSNGNTLIAGASGENTSQGCAFIFTRSGTTWSQQAKLLGTGGITLQGVSVAISHDGNTVAIGGSQNAGGVVIFTRSGITWTQQGSVLVGTGAIGSAQQGTGVSLSFDGNTLVSGGPFDDTSIGAAWVFTRSGTTWSQQGSKLVGTGSIGATRRQGTSVALSGDGNTLIIGGPNDDSNQGAFWTWRRSSGTWTQYGVKLVGTGNSGAAQQSTRVSISNNSMIAIASGVADNSNLGALWVWNNTIV